MPIGWGREGLACAEVWDREGIRDWQRRETPEEPRTHWKLWAPKQRWEQKGPETRDKGDTWTERSSERPQEEPIR